MLFWHVDKREMIMRKFLTVVAASGALALVSVAAPTAAEARCYGCGVAAGVVGGIAVGAAIANANRPYYNGPYDSGYTEPGYAYEPGYTYGSGNTYDAPAYRYRYGGSSCDQKNFGYDQQLQGTC
jgi:hypothetical protein